MMMKAYLKCPFLLALALLPAIKAMSQLPIKPDHTLSFTTDEGSFMSVDVSPDGRILAFDLLGNLYVLPVTGGEAKQLTHGMAVSFRPVWSPDGKKIACFSDYSGAVHINLMNLPGKYPKALGTTDRPLVANYESDILAWKPGGSGLITDDLSYDLSGKSISLPFKTNRGSFLQFSSSDSVAYYVEYNNDSDYAIKRYSSGHDVVTVMNGFPTDKLAASSVISPDGRWLAFLRDTDMMETMMARDLQTGADKILLRSKFIKQLLRHGTPGSGTQPQRPHYCFSPDSKYIYIGDGGKIHRITVMDGTDHIVQFQADVKLAMAPRNFNSFPISHQSETVHYTRCAQASPDGKYIVFTALNRIYIKDLPYGKPRLLVKQNISLFEPAMSPDGKWIAYVTWNDTTGGALWQIPLSGGKPELLSQSQFVYRRPAYSPDGQRIAFVKGRRFTGPGASWMKDDIGNLCILDLQSKKEKEIRDSVKLANKIVFSADSKRIFYQPYPYGTVQDIGKPGKALVSSGIDGQPTATVATAKPTNWEDIQPYPSSDGRYIVFTKDEDLYLVTRSKNGAVELFDQDKVINGIRFAHGVDCYWEKGGKILSWSYANKFYRIDPDKVMAVAKTKLKKDIPPPGLSGPTISYVDIKPDQVIPLDVPVPYRYAHGTIALKHVRIITMQGKKVINNGTVIIKDGRFAALGGKNLSIPANAKIIDLNGKTIMPGFVDLHLHLHETSDIFPNQYANYLANLAYGVTTARDPSSFYNAFGLTELLRSGQMTGPRLYSTGRPVRYYDGILQAGSQEELMAVVEKRKAMGGTFMKQYVLPDRQQREWLSIASKHYGLDMTNEGSRSALEELAMVRDGSPGVEHGASWGDLYKDYLMVWKLSGCYFTPTLLIGYDDDMDIGRDYMRFKYWREPDAKMRRFMTDEGLKAITGTTADDTAKEIYADLLRASGDYAKLRHAGANVTLGSHGEDQGIGVHNELWALQMGGHTNMEALQAATIMGARAIGIQKDVGSIEMGKIADLIILNSNPLDNIHNSKDIKYVMKDGILYDGNTLDELWPVKKKCPDWRKRTTAKPQY